MSPSVLHRSDIPPMIDFFEFSNEMLCIADTRGYFKRVNQAWTRTLGWTSEELTCRPYIEFVHPDDVAATLREAELLSKGQETVRFENRYRCRDGSYRWLAWKVMPDAESKTLIASARDETEQKKKTEALREAEQRFRALADYAPVGIAQADFEGNIYYVNDKWCELAGVTHREAMGMTWKEYVHPDDLAGVIQAWQEALQQGCDMPPYEYRFLHRNGHVRWASTTVALLKSDDGRIHGQIASAQDVTNRKVAELQFRSIYEQAPLGIALIDSLTGRFLQINPKYEEIIGRSEEEMKQLDFQRISHPEDLQADLDQMALLVGGKIRHFNMEKRLIRGDGSLIWVNLTVVAMWQPHEPPVCHLAIVEDITGRKATEDALRVKESQLRGILDNTTNVVYLKDLEGRYLLVNRQHTTLFHRPGETVIGKTDADWFPEEIAERFRSSDAAVIKAGVPLAFEEDALHDDGQHTYRSVKFPVIDENGQMIAVGGISTDITDLKSAHDALEIKQRLLRNLIEIQENERQHLCHEIHDGLIQYAVGALLTLEGCQTGPIPTDVAAKIKTAIVNLRKGIEDGRRTIRGIRPAVLDDSDLQAAIQDLVEQFAEVGIMVTCDCDPQIGRLPESVQTTLYRIVQEALNNARKHSGTDLVRISLRERNRVLLLEINDFGCGFDVESARGRGFGLVGMNERVRMLGGECQIESSPDSGTIIRVQLPIPAGEV